jgi:phosphatidylglycerol lysyltransferase
MRRWLPPLIGLASFTLAVVVLRRELAGTSAAEIAVQLRAIPAPRIVVAALLTALDFVPLCGLDWLALRVVGRTLPLGRLAATSFIGYAFSRAVGFAVLSGGAVRYRLLAAFGLGPLDIAKLVALAAMISWLGFLAIGGAVFLIDPPLLPEAITLPVRSTRLLGAGFLLCLLFYLGWCARRVAALKIGSWRLNLPTIESAFAQIIVAALDWVLAALVPYLLLAPSGMSFAHCIGVYMLAQVAGVASNVPAGLGVFETVMLLFLGSTVEPAAAIGAFAVYRLVFYVAPLAVAAALFGALEFGLGGGRRSARSGGR